MGTDKKKMKFNLNPRGMLWVKDDSKKCLKMMEKMGWEQGKGLGRNENGIVENIRANGNLGKKGLGKTSRSRDTWLDQQDDYSAVLADLNKMYGKEEEEERSKQTSFIDLGENCKKSTSRVFYSKLVQGKNLSNRSQKDLDCILGHNRTKERAKEEEPKVKEPITNKKESKEESKSDMTAQSSADLIKPQTMSMSDYFAKKLAMIRKATALKKNCEDQNTTNVDNNENKDSEIAPVDDKPSKDNTTNDNSQDPRTDRSSADQIKAQSMSMTEYFAKKMEAIKKAAFLRNNCDNNDSQDSKATTLESETVRPKKSRKRKHSDSEEQEEARSEEKTKKKKKQKSSTEEEEVKVEVEKPKKKRKSDKEEEVVEIAEEVENKKSKKSKKKKDDKSSKVEEVITVETVTKLQESKKKKKKSKE